MKQEETQKIGGKSPFIQKHSVSIRIWHWLVFVTISFLIITVLFNETLFNPWENAPMVQQVLKEKSIILTDDQAKAVAHEYSEKLWVLHKFLGIGLTLLFLARSIIEIRMSGEEKIKTKIKNALSLYRQNVSNKNDLKHYLIVRYSYSAFYLLLMYMAITGLLIAFGNGLGIARETRHFIKEIHGVGQFLMYAFIFFHLCGVIIADIKHSKGIISGMINGGE